MNFKTHLVCCVLSVVVYKVDYGVVSASVWRGLTLGYV